MGISFRLVPINHGINVFLRSMHVNQGIGVYKSRGMDVFFLLVIVNWCNSRLVHALRSCSMVFSHMGFHINICVSSSMCIGWCMIFMWFNKYSLNILNIFKNCIILIHRPPLNIIMESTWILHAFGLWKEINWLL